MDTSIHDREDNEMSLHGYELIDPLKNPKSTPVLETKELSLMILEITKLCCDICLFVQELNAMKCWCLFIGVLLYCVNNLWLFISMYILFLI